MNVKSVNLLVLALGIAITLVGAVFYYDRYQLNLEIELISLSDVYLINRFDLIQLELKNEQNHIIAPVFFVHEGVLEKPWKAIFGPRFLRPGEKAIYMLEAPFPHRCNSARKYLQSQSSRSEL